MNLAGILLFSCVNVAGSGSPLVKKELGLLLWFRIDRWVLYKCDVPKDTGCQYGWRKGSNRLHYFTNSKNKSKCRER